MENWMDEENLRMKVRLALASVILTLKPHSVSVIKYVTQFQRDFVSGYESRNEMSSSSTTNKSQALLSSNSQNEAHFLHISHLLTQFKQSPNTRVELEFLQKDSSNDCIDNNEIFEPRNRCETINFDASQNKKLNTTTVIIDTTLEEEHVLPGLDSSNDFSMNVSFCDAEIASQMTNQNTLSQLVLNLEGEINSEISKINTSSTVKKDHFETHLCSQSQATMFAPSQTPILTPSKTQISNILPQFSPSTNTKISLKRKLVGSENFTHGGKKSKLQDTENEMRLQEERKWEHELKYLVSVCSDPKFDVQNMNNIVTQRMQIVKQYLIANDHFRNNHTRRCVISDTLSVVLPLLGDLPVLSRCSIACLIAEVLSHWLILMCNGDANWDSLNWLQTIQSVKDMLNLISVHDIIISINYGVANIGVEYKKWTFRRKCNNHSFSKVELQIVEIQQCAAMRLQQILGPQLSKCSKCKKD